MWARCNEAEFRAFGITFENKVARFEEAFAIIRRLLAGERVSSMGASIASMTLCSSRGRGAACHYSIGRSGPRVLAATLHHVDWWNSWYSWYGNTPSGFERELKARW